MKFFFDSRPYYLWPYTNKYWFDRETKQFVQQVAKVRPVTLDEREHEAFPGFVAVELLCPDAEPTGIHNFVLPDYLYCENGYPISAVEAQSLVERSCSSLSAS